MFKSKSSIITAMTVLLTAFLVLIGCQSDAPTGINTAPANQVTILQVDRPAALHKGFKAEAYITEDDGGQIWIGDNWHGMSGLVFPEDAVDDDVWVAMSWESENLLQANFYPEGLQFEEPVYIRLSYKDANLIGVAEDNLAIYYYNPATGAWEYVNSTVNTSGQYVEGYINHFSRYAVGMD